MGSLTDYNKIPIKNLYYMLCYAWGHLAEKDLAKIAREDERDLTHLLTRILLLKLRSLIKRGFYREYKNDQEETSTLRGKILFQESINTFSYKRGKMHCEYEEMSHNILHNQLIKTTLYHLLLVPDLDKKLREEIQNLYKYFTEISLIKLNSRLYDNIKFHRSNYISWLDDLFYNDENEEPLEGDFDFKVVSNPHELREEIINRRGGRLLAGYAWNWTKNTKHKTQNMGN